MVSYAVPFTTLVDTATLGSLVGDPDVAIVDCRFQVDDVTWGRREYESRHIPGAVFADVENDLSGPKGAGTGRHPLPEPAAFVETLSVLGIDSRVQVVVYDQDAGMYASRLWWMLRWMGHEAVALLDGGFARWTAEGRRSQAGAERRPRRQFAGTPRPDMLVTFDDVARRANEADWRLLDARAPERYRGEVEPIDARAGHIPGAANLPYRSNVAGDHRFLSPDTLRQQFRGTIGDIAPDRVICYCGSGVTACQNLLALEHAGLHGAKLYPGSWSEWIARQPEA